MYITNFRLYGSRINTQKWFIPGAQLAYKECGFKIIQGGQGACPPENFEINGAIWRVLGPPESFLDQRKSIYFSIKMEMKSFTFVYFNQSTFHSKSNLRPLLAANSLMIISISITIKKFFCQNNVDSAAYSRIGSYAPEERGADTPSVLFCANQTHQRRKIRCEQLKSSAIHMSQLYKHYIFLKIQAGGFTLALAMRFVFLVKVQSHYSVWHQRLVIRSHTQIYNVRQGYARHTCTSCTFLIRWHTLMYVVIPETKLFFGHVDFFSVCKRIDNTLLIRSSYARHTLNTLDIR